MTRQALRPLKWFVIFLLLDIAAAASAATVNGIEIDEQATAQAPWKAGEVVPYSDELASLGWLGTYKVYRVFLGVTPQGYYVIQEFYADNNAKLTDPYVVRNAHDVERKGYDLLGVAEGRYIAWHSNGQKYMEAQVIEGRQEGEWKYWYNSGQLKTITRFVSGMRQGWEEEWLQNGQIYSRRHFKDGTEDGLCTIFYSNGIKFEETTYIQGRLVGLGSWWHNNGQLQVQGLRNENGELQGEWREWDYDGNLISQEWYENGWSREEKEDMTNRVLAQIVDGTVGGIVIDAQATARAPWKAGEWIYVSTKQGRGSPRIFLGATQQDHYVIQDFYDGYFGEGVSSPKCTDPYVVRTKEDAEQHGVNPNDRVFEGMYISWFPEGQKQYQALMVDGIKEGEWKFWNYSGHPLISTSYINGKRNGWDEVWTPVHTRCHYKNEQLDGSCVTWYDNGVKAREETYRQGVRTGLQSWWHDNGKMQAQVSFNENGKPHGEARGYDRDDNLVEIIWFENGKEVRREGYSATPSPSR